MLKAGLQCGNFLFYFYFLLTSQKSLIVTMSTLCVCVSTAQAPSSHCSRQDHKSYCFIPYIVLTDKPLGPHWLALLRESHLETAVLEFRPSCPPGQPPAQCLLRSPQRCLQVQSIAVLCGIDYTPVILTIMCTQFAKAHLYVYARSTLMPLRLTGHIMLR